MPYQLTLFGRFTITPPPDAPPIDTLNRKTRAILAYLAATGRPHSRQHLCDWFCQAARDPAGTLRWHLSQIRRQVAGDVLDVTRHTAAIRPAAVLTDCARLEAALANLDDTPTDALAQAVALYRGPFLAALSLPDAPEFELWQLAERTRLQRLYEKGAAALVVRHVRQGDHAAALPVAETLLRHNPLLETVHGYLIWLYAHTGQRAAALRQYAHCRQLLAQELAVDPSPELQALHAAVKHNQPLPAILPPQRPFPPTLPATDTPFVGRAAELARLAALWRAGRTVALVAAPAGGGKTRLLHAFSRQLPPDAPRLAGSCYESTRAIPYFPWQAVLAQQLRALDAATLARLAPYWRRQLALLLPQLGEGAASPNQHQLFRAIVHLLTGLDPRPRLLLLDDLQWADDASLQLVQFVAQQLGRAVGPLMLVATFRAEETADNPALLTLLSDLARLPHATRLTLAPFDDAETAQLLAALWPRPPEPRLHRRLQQATGGNPLYLTELLQELTLAETLPAELPIPPSLAGLIARRLQQLPANGRQVIESLAILDQPAGAALAQQISARDAEETVAAIDKGLHWRLLHADPAAQVRFSHELTRTAVLQQISPVRRQRLHRRAAVALAAAQAPAATLAYHWEQAGDPAQASRHALTAAQQATAVYAVDDALRFYRRALPHLAAADKLDAMRQLGRLYLRISDWDAAHAVLTAGLAAAAPDSAAAAHFQILLGQLHARQSHYDQALARLQAAYALCQKLADQALRGQCVGTMGIVHYLRDAYAASLACYEEALAIAQARDDEENVAVWLSNIATIYLQQGEPARALAHLQQAAGVQKQLGNQEQLAVAVGNMGDIHRRLGQHAPAVAHHQEAAQLRHAWGDRAGVATNLRDLGLDYAEVGQSAAALHCFWQALTLDVELGRRDACGQLLHHLARLLPQPAEALAALETAAALLRLTHSRYDLCRCLLDLADHLWPDADWPRLAALLDEAAALADDLQQPELTFAVRLAAIRLRAARQQLPLPDAIAALAALPQDDAQLAAAGDAICQLDPTQAAWQRETAVRYAQLHAQTPLAAYRRRHAALSGDTLPPPPPLPAPPTLVTPLADTLPPYLDRLH